MPKIKVKDINIDKFNLEEVELGVLPKKPNRLLQYIIYLYASIYLKLNKFTLIKNKLDKKIHKTPCVIIMNHVNLIDAYIAAKLLRKFHVHCVASDDVFVGKKSFLQSLGCYSIFCYETSPSFVKDSYNIINKKKESILIYPEANYSLDGCGEDIAPQFGKFIKLLKAPVLLIRSYGVYSKIPLFNEINNKNKISAKLSVLLTKEDIQNMKVEDIQDKISKAISDIDYYQEHKELKLEFNNHHADYIERFIYKCPHCHKEFDIVGHKMNIKCNSCGQEYQINKDGTLINISNNKDNKIIDISKWVKWQKEELIKELKDNTFNINIDAYVYAYKNYKRLYKLPYLANININKDICKIKMNNTEHVINLRDCYDIRSETKHFQFGPTLVIRIGDIRYFLVFIKDNGSAYKLKSAVIEAFRLSKQ